VVPGVALTLLAAGFLLALVIEWLVWRGALRLRVLAHPNQRSSHIVPTPTTGGIAFVLPVVAYLGWLGVLGSEPALTLAIGGLTLAAVGLWDDLREVAPLLRILVHALVAAGFVTVLLPDSAWIVLVVLTVVLVWHINLYNFMDGIDGLAGAQGLVYLVGAQLIGQGVPGWPGDLTWLACGGLLAFLVFNWPPARIFMGDVGSGFLGLLTGALALLLWQQQSLPLTASLILLCGFWFDASYTLIIRLLTGQAFTQAHRSHLYQKVAARQGHRWTTVVFVLYGIFWLVPLAWLSARSAHDPMALLWLVPAVAPLAVAAWRVGAGAPAASARGRHD
jgi:Fuc2NAc and GlcNAc transferase